MRVTGVTNPRPIHFGRCYQEDPSVTQLLIKILGSKPNQVNTNTNNYTSVLASYDSSRASSRGLLGYQPQADTPRQTYQKNPSVTQHLENLLGLSITSQHKHEPGTYLSTVQFIIIHASCTGKVRNNW